MQRPARGFVRAVAVRAACAAYAACAIAVVGALTACREPPPDKVTQPPPEASTPKRPPQPVMASPVWGERVALERSRAVPEAAADAKPVQLVAEAQRLLLSLEPGTETRAETLLWQAWKGAPDDQTRGLALALAAVAMVWEPSVEGYVERLTDAYGLALYAGTVDTTSAHGQAARGIVASAGGAVRQGRDLVDLLARMPRQPDDLGPWLALARASANDRRQAFFDEAAAALKTAPTAWRVRAALADRLVDLGLFVRAVEVADAKDAPAAVRLVFARALVLDGRAPDARPVLEGFSSTLAGVDEPRRSEALYWLGEAQLALGDVSGARATAASLEPRPGWRREAALLAASVALLDGRVDDAKQLLLPLVAGTPGSTVQVERRIGRLTLEVCAELKDQAGLERAERFLQVVDVDPEGVVLARARFAREAGAALRTGADLWTSVMRQDGPTRALQAARRAIASDASELARPVVDELVRTDTARAARALRVHLEEAPAAKARAAVLALQGKGPPLGERDLLAVLDAIGGAATPEGPGLLGALAADPRPAVQKAVARAENDLRNPTARQKRLADDEAEHRHAPDPRHEGQGPGLPGATP